VAATEIVIVGGGIAGLATAASLAEAGARVVLLEKEPILASHSSGRNAAIWLPATDDATTPELSRGSAARLDALLGGRERWLQPTGALFVSDDPNRLEGAERGGRSCGMVPERLGKDEAVRLSPGLGGGNTAAALWLPGGAVMDIHAVTQALARCAREAGATIRTGRGVVRIATRRGRVEGVDLEDGSRLAAACVVVAAGAWSASLGATCQASLPLVPLRRHLVQLEAPLAAFASGPVVWSLGSEEVYYRPESGGLLASPCDERPWEACLPAPDAAGLESLGHKLRCVAPGLLGSRVRRAWACLRTFALDRELVTGRDPRVEGLFWLAGLGGRGMAVGVAAGELAAQLVLGRAHPLSEAVSPARLL
jgi:D-arginine dehydrogenase